MASIRVSEEGIEILKMALQNVIGDYYSLRNELEKAYFVLGESWLDANYLLAGEYVTKYLRETDNVLYVLEHCLKVVDDLENAFCNYMSPSLVTTVNRTSSSGTRTYYSIDERALGPLSVVLGNFVPMVWSAYDITVKRRCVYSLLKLLCRLLGIVGRTEVRFFSQDSVNGAETLGYFDAARNLVCINNRHLDDPLSIIDTVAHEVRHVWQKERARKKETERDKQFAENLTEGNYVQYEVNPMGYYNQPVEKDARLFAEAIKSAMD